MPYILSPIIKERYEGMWFEGDPYKKNSIYKISENDEDSPPVNYSSYTIKPHSLTHLETRAHTSNNGNTVDYYFSKNIYEHFWGKTTVIKLKGDNFVKSENDENIKVWKITIEEILTELEVINNSKLIPKRLLISLENLPLNIHGLHDPKYVLVLSEDAARYLVDNGLKLYGTSWKSSDYEPNSKLRPIHNTLFESALIMECLDLDRIPSGNYFLNAFPLPLEGASESPLCPILYTREEVLLEI